MGKAKRKKARKEAKKAKETVAPGQKRIKLIAENRKARHLYAFAEEIEAGLVLTGTEVKSCRQNQVQLRDAYAAERRGEFFLFKVYISPYSHGNIENHEPERTRKVLLKQREANKLFGKIREKGYTLVPIKMYFKGPWVKVLLGLGKGKTLYDKRASKREKEQKREVERALKDY